MSILTAVTKEACDIVDAELEGRLAEDGVAVVSSQLAPVGPSLSIGKFGRRVCNDRAYRLHLGRRRGAVKGVANGILGRIGVYDATIIHNVRLVINTRPEIGFKFG